jgi:hypothetical protein
MSESKLIFFFPSNIFSGHERMALKVIKTAHLPINCISHHAIVPRLITSYEVQSYSNKKQMISSLVKFRKKFRNPVVVLVSGSPYGFIFHKFLLRFLGFYLIEYVPVPELDEIKDRFHHYLMPFVNKLFVNHRILIDDWQIKYSAVKKCSIIKNLVSDD